MLVEALMSSRERSSESLKSSRTRAWKSETWSSFLPYKHHTVSTKSSGGTKGWTIPEGTEPWEHNAPAWAATAAFVHCACPGKTGWRCPGTAPSLWVVSPPVEGRTASTPSSRCSPSDQWRPAEVASYCPYTGTHHSVWIVWKML